MVSKVICNTCGMSVSSNDCLIVVIESDTNGTLVSRRFDENDERFNNRYHSLVDSGRYPNMGKPEVECKSCRYIRYKELEEEAEYWANKALICR